MTKLLQQCFLFFIVVVIPGHNLGHSQVSVNRTNVLLRFYYMTDCNKNNMYRIMRKPIFGFPTRSDTMYSLGRGLEALNFGLRKERDCTIYVAKR